MIKANYLTITPFFPNAADFRGPFIYDQVKAIKETGQYNIVVLKPKPWYSFDKDYEFEGIKIYRFTTFDLPSNILPGLFDFLSILSLKNKLKTIGIKNEAIEVVHAHVTGLGIYPVALKKNNPNIKSILQHHGFDVLSLENGKLYNQLWHRNWVRNYGINICNAIDLHVGVSKKTLSFLKNENNLKIRDSYVLYNGVDTAKFYPIQNRKAKSCFTLGCVGNFWALKDQLTLLKAVKILIDNGMNDLKVILVGTGTTLSICENYVTDNQLNEYIEFIEKIPHNQLVYFYNTLDLFMLPSYHEAFGCVYTEAYSCGIPFIAIENQGISELLPEDEKDKWLIQKGNHRELAAKIAEYKTHRYKQNLIVPIDIKHTTKSFLNYLSN